MNRRCVRACTVVRVSNLIVRTLDPTDKHKHFELLVSTKSISKYYKYRSSLAQFHYFFNRFYFLLLILCVSRETDIPPISALPND